eukprot:2795280-Amphidinium_carterae.1
MPALSSPLHHMDPMVRDMLGTVALSKATPYPKRKLTNHKNGPVSSQQTFSGREDSDVDVVQLAKAVEALGAGEILLNCIDRDGQGTGYELELIQQVKAACPWPSLADADTPEKISDVWGLDLTSLCPEFLIYPDPSPIPRSPKDPRQIALVFEYNWYHPLGNVLCEVFRAGLG